MENKENEIQAQNFLNIANIYYNDNSKKWRKHCLERNLEWNEDVYSDTILKVYDYIKHNGLKYTDEQGILNYWFKSFITNIKREKQYSRNVYRDMNVDASMELDKEYNGDEELQQKIRRQVYDDWVVVKILQIVEQNFDTLSFRCFRLYYIVPKMTYQKLRELTNIKDCKKRVNMIKTWIRENININELNKEFNKYYDN